jgi:O-antigen/teichoic acid export membrane protein
MFGQPKRTARIFPPLLLASFLSFMLYQLTTLLLGIYRFSHEVGLYAAALRTSFFLLFILDSFDAVFAPLIAILTGRQKKIRKYFQGNYQRSYFPFFVSFLNPCFSGQQVLSLWGSGYKEGF